MLDRTGNLPAGLMLGDFLEVDAAFQYRSFWCQVFPRTGTQQEGITRRLVFPATLNGLRTPFGELLHLANVFESLMEERRRAEEAREWRRLLSAHAAMLMAGEIAWVSAHRDVGVPRPVRQKIEILAIITAVTADAEMAAIANRWDAAVRQSADGASLPQRLCPGMRLARAAANAPLADAFALLIEAMRQFVIVAERSGGDEEMIRSVLRTFPGAAVLVPFVIINAAVAHTPGFMSDRECRCWVIVERCILESLRADSQLLRDVIAKQVAIERITRTMHTSGADRV
jgi:hypothetical protein